MLSLNKQSNLSGNYSLLAIICLFYYVSSPGDLFNSQYLVLLAPVISAKVYSNADTQKESIIKENRGKCGIYRWINKENGKSYIGSSVNLARRFQEYFSVQKLMEGSASNMPISRALR
jgi:hypothetical protein